MRASALSRYSTAIAFYMTAVTAIAPSARAGGLLAQELANPRGGTAQAGQAAYAGDAATAIYNPAAMSRLDEPQLLIGVQPIWTQIEFDRDPQTTFSGGDGGEQGGLVPSLGTYYVRPLKEGWAVGVAVAGIAGGALDPGNSWAGRFFITELSLTAIALNPVVSYRVNDWLSVGGGFSLNYGLLNFKLRIPGGPGEPEGRLKMDAVDDLTPSFNVGVLLEPVEGTRFGLAYRSKVDFELDGDFDVRDVPPVFAALGLTDGDVQAKIPVPQLIRASVYHQLTDRVAVLADLGWEDWSENAFTPISGPAGRTLQLPRDWRDTWHFGLGLEWRVAPAWLLQTGIAHDTSPVRSRRKNFPDMPADRQWRYSFGVVHDWSDSLQLAFNYTWIDLGKARIDAEIDLGVASWRLVGEYDQNRAHVFSFSAAF